MDPDVAEAMEIDSYNASLDFQAPPSPQQEAEDAEIDAEIASRTLDLHTLALQAQHQLYQQPRSTQQKLTSQTRNLYHQYAQHGSMVRLSEQLRKFLLAPEPLSSDPEHVEIWSDEEVKVLNDMYPDTAIPCNTERNFEELCAKSDATVSTAAGRGRKASYSNDPESTMIVHDNPFHPADLKIGFPAYLDMPTVFMQSINNMLLLENSSAQARLRHLEGKYCLPGPGADEGHPHALPLLRLGISCATTATLSNIFETAATNEFGLTPESRRLLRQAYAAQSGRVNDTEITWLARSLRVGEDVVREWWAEEDSKRRGEKIMMVWLAARELERARWYRERGMG